MNLNRPKAYEDVLRPFQRVVDLILIVVVHALASSVYGQPWRREMGSATVFVMVIFTIINELTGVYRPRHSEDLVTETRPVIFAWLVTAACLAFFLFATKTSTSYSRVISYRFRPGQEAQRLLSRSGLR